MKAVGILGSPRKEGNSSKMLRACLEELSNAGFETEFVYLQEKKIRYCIGCGTCLREGECIFDDEMTELKEIVKNAKVLVLASPVYFLNVSAQMKCFIDRMLAFGHRPSLSGYGGSIVTYAGVGEPKVVADYLNRVLKAWGIYPVGYAIGFGVMPGDVKEEDIEKAKMLGKQIAKAFEDRIKPEAKKEDFTLQNQLITLIKNYKEFMKADYEFWKDKVR
ncbi:MAG: flavodoxin family protein [Archaeoglobaceae archaeon]|nr:flavodoxin family protein [Archaeoglobaceae archaeon]MDW8118194.1 flavodoxin family protein [Archaeoglobaceae archaeon]